MAAQDKNKAANNHNKKFQKSYFDVLGLCCSSEVPLIENILKSLDGVKEYSVIVPTRTVVVVHDNLLLSQLQIVKALNQARLEANVRVHGDISYQKKWPSPFAVASGVLLLLSLLKYVYHPLHWLALGAVAVGIIPIFLKAIASIRNFRLDTNILVLIAVIGTVALKDYAEAGTIVFLFTIAEWLESRAGHKANAVMSSLMNIAPQKAVIAETGEEVDVDEVKLNTIVAVKAGEIIPIDGVVVDGNSEVDEKTLTGESFPVPKLKDSTVWAGTINLNGYVNVKTTALAEDCVVAKMAKLVEEAQNSKSTTQRFIDKIAQYYTPAVIIISASLAGVPLAFRVDNLKHWLHLALVVLVSACPCALILSTPVATFCALTKAATSGVLIKGGDYLETLSKIKVVAFDKTGTITRGEFVVVEFQSLCQDISIDTLLYWVSCIESKSSHPMAAALVDYGRSLSVEPRPENVEEFQNFPGEGIHGKIDGKEIYIGNRKMGIRAGCERIPLVEMDTKSGKTIGYVYSGATPAGVFSLSDACRTGVAEAIAELKSLRIKTAMLTGDGQAAAMHAQQQLGNALEIVHAELLPEDKARIIEAFKKEGKTAMIGDGLNDAPALATADIGISMGISGSALATETAHVILMSNDIRKVPKAIQLAKKAHKTVIQNVILSISTKSAILALAFAGHPLIWAAVLADVGTCLLVILNSMLLLRETHKKHRGKCCNSKSAEKIKKCDSHHSSHHHKQCCEQNVERACTTHKSQRGKCCKSTSAEKIKKCDSNIKRCCDKKVEKQCRPSCASKCEPNANNKCTDSAELKHCNHSVSLESKNQQKHSCSGLSTREKCTNSVQKEGKCNEGEHSPPSHCISNHSNHSTDMEPITLKNSKNGHCHDHHCGKDHANIHVEVDSLENIVDSGFTTPRPNQQKPNYCSTSQMAAVHVCMSLEKREMGGCCKSYMKECCDKHGQFASGLGGSLSEIIIE
ncbi:hypothetical protein JCGZ_04570 [Jatropha curcas]|uniref:HMA domain-containing protein n=1 Tax=Jatropha curcas TaxID=180498 RepID=A0A067LDS3_JATCU|nr:putative inactive cadmium/zinc-transporting ATPase HMA3 [Jatropha curcas]KDP46636.1 hypothetical protein JCGZ_04570 [Jatropha curcas]